MEKLFCRFCHFYATEGSKKEYDELKKEAKDNVTTYQKKAIKFVKNLRRKTRKLGYGLDFESFCNLLEEYINKKDNLTDVEKKNYLKILISLSEIYEINLREELERYISNKPKPKVKISEDVIFKLFCQYNLDYNNDVKKFNKLKKIVEENKLDFNELQQKSISFVEETKALTTNLGFDTSITAFNSLKDKYLQHKNKMSDNEKATYLRVLLYLSEIYNLNLREILKNTDEDMYDEEVIEETITPKALDGLSNPLHDTNILSKMLNQRYHSGYFKLEEISFNSKKSLNKKDFDIYKIQATLLFNLYRMFIAKFNNYSFDDLNPKFTNLVAEDDIEKLYELTEEDLYNIITDINKRESSKYVINKYQLSENLYNFMFLSIDETTDFKIEHLNQNKDSLFNTVEGSPTISIYLSMSEYELTLFLSEYIRKCVEKDLYYAMKGICKNNETDTYCILYANEDDYNRKIDIIEEIISENKEWNKSYDKPFAMTGTYPNSLYGISEIGLLDENNNYLISYQDYIDSISEIAYYRVLAKLVSSKITDEKALGIINSFIVLNNVTLDKDITKYKYNEVYFDTIKDLVNQYIPLISNTLNIYMEEKDKQNSLIEEFKKSLGYIANISHNIPKKSDTNIAIINLLKIK